MTRTLLTLTLGVLLLPGMAREANAGPHGRPLRTGQTTCWDSAGNVIVCAGTAQDGELRPGLAHVYVDNGNGTITEQKTGLTWEKLSDDGSIHDKDNKYTWADAFGKVDDLNTSAFAGFTDWRLPSLFELNTLVNLGNNTRPAVSAVFNTNCGANSSGNLGCTVTTCSCTVPNFYWSSSTYTEDPQAAWFVYFTVGYDGANEKIGQTYARAVRGGGA